MEVVFQGETALTVDDKGRMAIPTAYRQSLQEACGGRLVVTYNPFERGCLWLFPQPEWERIRDEVMALRGFNSAHRTLQRKLVAAASPVEPDGQGRILLPQTPRQIVGIDRRAVLLGMGAKFELWSEEAHLRHIGEIIEEADISEAMHELRF